MSESNLSFAKIVANPSIYSWSQAYNSGKLFAVLSLETKGDIEEKDYLNVLGKEILETFEQEYYALETKDLESVKKAVLITTGKIPHDVNCSFVTCSIINNILYIYILGNGKVSLKREGKLGNLLEASDQKPDSLKAASGFLQDSDLIILQTKQFSNIISAGTLSEFLDDLAPSDAAENIAPLLHEKEESGAAAIIINYKTPAPEEEVSAPLQNKEEETQEKEEGKQESPFYMPSIKRNVDFPQKIKTVASLFFSKIKLQKNSNLNHPRKVILTIVIIIIIVFVSSVFFAIKKQQDTKVQVLFQNVYPQAQKKYDEGQGLLGLNQNLAHDSFQASQKILEDGKPKFPKNSKEEKQILALLDKVNLALNSSSGITSVSTNQVDNNTSAILASEIKNPNASYFTQDDKNVYFLDSNGISFTPKAGGNAKVIIKSSELPKNIGGLGIYYGNVYVLDKNGKQIDKFIQTSEGFSKASYFTSGVSPDLSNASAITIDGSIWVLFSNGTIGKFTKGNQDNFSISGLDKGFSSPSKIYTTVDFSNVYILDKGNSRIVVLDKNGSYKAQYQASILKNATDFEVLESDKKIYILSGGKEYKIDLK